MASPLYNDKTLAAQEQKRKLGVTVEQPDVAAGDYVQDPSADQLLADAHNTLDSANQFGADNDTERLAKLPESLNALRGEVDKRGVVRKITEPLAQAGGAVGGAGLLAAPINPAIGGAMMTGGGLATVPDYLRRLIAPEQGESRPGAMETGITGLALMPAMGSLRGLKNVAQEARTAATDTEALSSAWKAAEEVPYRAGSGAMVDGARGAEQAEANAIVRRMRAEPKRPIDAFYESDPAAKFGGEGRMTGQFQEGKGGLSDLRAGLLKPNANPTIEGKPVADRLAELSSKVSPRRQEELAAKFGGKAPESGADIIARRKKGIEQSERALRLKKAVASMQVMGT